jgi:type II secretory pathway component PulF
MPKFKIDVVLDGYDTEEEMFNAITEDEIYEALSDYGFTVISVESIKSE